MAMASLPLAATSACQPSESTMRASSSRALALSSTIRARSAPISGRGGVGDGSSATTASGSRSSKEKVLPAPSTLSRCNSPPIRPTRRWQMASPSPVPPKRRVVEASACEKPLKMWPWFSGEMPMPLSLTATSSSTSSSVRSIARRRSTTWPTLVNLIALPPRLMSTCCSRMSSPSRPCGSAGSMS